MSGDHLRILKSFIHHSRIDVRISERRLRLIIAEAVKLSRGDCNQRHSLAWIDPEGEVHMLDPYDTHENWAHDVMKKNGWETWYTPNFELLLKGYVRVTNGTTFSFIQHPTNVPQRVMRSVVDIMMQCVQFEEDGPEDLKTVIEYGQSNDARLMTMSVADFIEKYAEKDQIENFYSALMR